MAAATKAKPLCAACEKPSAKRRTKCPKCGKLVGGCCWDQVAHLCFACRDHDRPKDRTDLAAHLARIAARRDALDQAIKVYESACCAFWEGVYERDKLAEWGANPNAPSVSEAFDAYVLVIRQACEDLETPEEMIEFPTIEFPGFCEDGSVDYEPGNLEALELGICGVGEEEPE